MKTLLSALLGLSLISGIALANSGKDKKTKKTKKPAITAPANPEEKPVEATTPASPHN